MKCSTGLMRPQAAVPPLEARIRQVIGVIAAKGAGRNQRAPGQRRHLMTAFAAIIGAFTRGLSGLLGHGHLVEQQCNARHARPVPNRYSTVMDKHIAAALNLPPFEKGWVWLV